VRQQLVELRHPGTIAGSKMTYAKNQGLGGAFFWEFSGDTSAINGLS
jgi:GH18 family chitinase